MVIDTPEACQKAVKCLLDKGPEFVVLTLGSKGAMFGQKEGGSGSVMQVEPDKDIIPEKVIDTTVRIIMAYTLHSFYKNYINQTWVL